MSRKILVADGDQPTLELITAVMTRNGFQVQATHDGGDALSRFMEHEPELIVCGDTLPVVSGVKLCRQVKSECPKTRVVLLLGADLAESERQAEAEHAGCDAVLVRPFRFAPLKQLLGEWGYDPGAGSGSATAGAPETEGQESFAVPAPPTLDPLHVAALAPPEPDALSTLGASEAVSAGDTLPGPDDPMPIPLPLAPPEPPSESAPPTPLAPVDIAEESAATLDPELQIRPPEHQPPTPLEQELSLRSAQAQQPQEPAEQDHDAPTPEVEAETQRPPEPEHAAEPEARIEDGHEEPELTPASPTDIGAACEQVLSSTDIAEPDPARQDEAAPGDEELSLPMATRADVLRARNELLAAEESSGPVQLDAADPEDASTLPLPIPREGNLAQLPLPRLLYELYMATFTGTVHLSRHGLRRSIHIVGGFPVDVDSQQLSENLGRLLVEHGRVTEAQYEQAQQLMQEKGCQMEEALLSIAALRESELLQAFQTQTERKLSNAFAWRDGAYALSETRDVTAGDGRVHPLRAILQGVREHYDAASLRAFHAPLQDRYVVATSLFAVHYDTLGPFLREHDIAKLLDGSTTFAAALDVDESRQADRCRALYVLLVTDMVRASAEPGEPVPGLSVFAEQEQGVSAPAPAGPEVTELCDRLAKARLAVRNATYFKVLNVEPEATMQQVEAAYQTAVAPWRPEALPAELPQEAKSQARELATVLARARDTLCDPERRSRYVELLQRGGAGPGNARPGDEPTESPTDGESNESLKAEQAYQQGVKLMEAGDYDSARQKFEEAVASNKDETLFHVGLGRAVLAADCEGELPWRKAGVHFVRALQLDPSSLEANLAMAQMLFQTEHWRTGRPYVLRVLQRAPESQEARAMLDKLEGIDE